MNSHRFHRDVTSYSLRSLFAPRAYPERAAALVDLVGDGVSLPDVVAHALGLVHHESVFDHAHAEGEVLALEELLVAPERLVAGVEGVLPDARLPAEEPSLVIAIRA